jgi:HK97 family phage portal protein
LEFKIFGKTFEIGIKNQALPALSSDSDWTNYLKGAGYGVSSDTALKIAVVIRCVDVVSKSMASMGCNLFRETKTGRELAKQHNLYRLLKYMPNRETTAYEFWSQYILNLMLTSGAYAKIVRDQNGFIQELWNIPTSHVTPYRNSVTGERYIEVVYPPNSHTGIMGERIYESNMMYTPGIRINNEEQSEDFIRIAADVLGLTIHLNSYADDYFKNGSNLGGFITYPNGINETAFMKFKEDWGKAYSGVANSHKYAILEGGFDIKKFDSNPEQSQALESRKFQIIEVCRLFGVPPSKVFALETMTYNSMEQANIEYTNESLEPMNVRLAQTIHKDLLNSLEKKSYYANFDTKKLLKGDIAARTAYYHNARQDGWMSANDIRELEDMNDIPAEDGGNIYAINGNMIPITAIPLNLPKGATKGGSDK